MIVHKDYCSDVELNININFIVPFLMLENLKEEDRIALIGSLILIFLGVIILIAMYIENQRTGPPEHGAVAVFALCPLAIIFFGLFISTWIWYYYPIRKRKLTNYLFRTCKSRLIIHNKSGRMYCERCKKIY